jgi:hypothetical protein
VYRVKVSPEGQVKLLRINVLRRFVSHPTLKQKQTDNKPKGQQLEQILTCPITHELFQDPMVASDGHTYERAAIARVIETTGVSPLTRERLTGELFPNRLIRSLLRDFEVKEI